MMARKIFNLKLDLKGQISSNPRIVVRRNDFDTNIFQAQIFQNGIPIDLTGYAVEFECVTPAGDAVRDTGNLVDAVNGKISYTLADQLFTSIGKIDVAYFVFEKQNGDRTERLSTPNFIFSIQNDALTNHAEAGDYVSDIATMLEKLNRIKSDYTTLDPEMYVKLDLFNSLIGNFNELGTKDKSSIVNAINQLNYAIGDLPIELFGGKGDGITDNSQALFNGLTFLNSVNGGGCITLNHGRYLFTSPTVTHGINVRIKGCGRVIKGTDETIWQFMGGWGDVYSVKGINNKLITLATEGMLERNDIIRVISNDTFSGVRYTSHFGEYSTIDAITSETEINIMHALKLPFSSNIRVAKLLKIPCSIIGLKFDLDDSSRLGNFMTIDSFYEPKINIKLVKCNGTFIQSVSNYQPDFIASSDFQENNDDDMLGYMISDVGSYNGKMHDSRGHNLRHMFTTGSLNTTDTPGHYGETMFFTVENCTGDSCTNAPFDSHENGMFIRYVNCHALNSKSAGFQARSDNAKFINCSSFGVDHGLHVFNYDGTSMAKNIDIVGCHFHGRLHGLYLEPQDGTSRVKNVHVSNSLVESDTDVPIYSTGADNVLVDGGSIIKSNSYAFAVDIQNTLMTILNSIIDLSNVTSGTVYIANISLSSSLKIRNTEYRVSSGVKAMIASSMQGSDATNELDAQVILEHDFTTPVNTLITQKTNFTKILLDLLPNRVNSGSMVANVDIASSPYNFTYNYIVSSNRFIFIITSMTGDASAGTINPGVRTGQLLIIINKSAHTITFNNSTTNVQLQSDSEPLALYDSIKFIWSGLEWIEL